MFICFYVVFCFPFSPPRLGAPERLITESCDGKINRSNEENAGELSLLFRFAAHLLLPRREGRKPGLSRQKRRAHDCI
jgi:hypothetical protein